GGDGRAGIDVLRLRARRFVGVIDDRAERGVVDALVAGIRRQRHWRLVQGFPRHDVVPAGEVLAVAAKVDAGEDDLRAGGADVDADRDQRHMILNPDRLVFARLSGPGLRLT